MGKRKPSRKAPRCRGTTKGDVSSPYEMKKTVRTKLTYLQKQTSNDASRTSQTNSVSIAPNTEDSVQASPKLLGIPPEVRYEIYQYHLQDCGRVHVPKKSRFVSSGALHLICKQVDTEMASLLATTSRLTRDKLCCTVHDFDFKPAIAALMWLVNDTDLLKAEKHSEKPIFTVRLSISKAWSNCPNIDGIKKWYSWLDINSKQDTALQIVYAIGGVERRTETEKFLNSLLGVGGKPRSPHPELQRIIVSFTNWCAEQKQQPDQSMEDLIANEVEWAMKYGVDDVGMMV